MTTKEYRRWLYQTEFKPAYDALMACYPFTTENLCGEIWRSISGYDDYQISNFGRVKSFKQGKIIILKPALTVYGYLIVNVFKDNKRNQLRINRLVALAFIDNPENKPEVNHLHGRFNNHFDCLEWATGSENQQHAVKMGLRKSGEDNYRAKLTL